MRLYLETIDSSRANSGFDRLITFVNGKSICANLKDADLGFVLKDGSSIYLYGDIFYYRRSDGSIKLIDSDSNNYIKNIFSENCLKDIISNLEGQYIGIYVDKQNGCIKLFTDRYARPDTFYTHDGLDFYLATDLDYIFRKVKPEYDQKMLAHVFLVYGWYTPKGLTIYKNVKQISVGEIITLSESGINSEKIKFKPLDIVQYEDGDLEDYYKILRESVISRANRGGKTWVSSSSGWDSSILLGILVDEFGARDVGMLTGSMKYSHETETINKYEINKINRIGEFYGIKPEIVDLDFMSKTASDNWKKDLPYFKSKHMYTYATNNFANLSRGLRNVAGEGQTIFNGETSDSFHNFGFSQFTTFFHTKKTFTEYADKMNCYLYGPSFFKSVLDGTYEKDKVFQIFKKMMGSVEFANGWSEKEDTIESLLFPFFYGSPRVPFAITYNSPALTSKGKKAIYDFPFREYMPEVLSDISEHNIYSILVYLYLSFHSQGSTVGIHNHAMEYNGHKSRAPFNDYRMIEFLSKAPENWGRGLELNNTKFPLKWVAKNKIRFPYGFLDEGPHAYLYDVMEGFSLFAEITYRSGVTELFKDSVKSKPYKELLLDEYFDVQYLDNLCDDYLQGKEAKGQDFNSLVSLITLCITGWY